MRKLAGLALVGAVAVAAGAFVSYGGLDRAASLIGDSSPKASVAANSASEQGPIDYNCALPGSGFAWLEQQRARDNWHGDLDAPYHLGGIFVSTVPSGTGDTKYAVALPVRIREDGAPSSMADVYRLLCAVHPDLGGSGLRAMTPEEKRKLDLGDVSGAPDDWDAGQIPDLYTDGVVRAADEAHIGWEQIRVYLLPPIPQDLRDALSSAVVRQHTPTPSPTPTPTPAPETRHYVVTVVGYEQVDKGGKVRLDNANPSVTESALFHYQLKGKLTIAKKGNGAWRLSSAEITSAALQVAVLQSPPECWSQTKQTTNRAFAKVQQATRLKGYVNNRGDGTWGIVLDWGDFMPEVGVDSVISADAHCGGSGQRFSLYFDSQRFFAFLSDEDLEIMDRARLDQSGGTTDTDKQVRIHYNITLVRQPD